MANINQDTVIYLGEDVEIAVVVDDVADLDGYTALYVVDDGSVVTLTDTSGITVTTGLLTILINETLTGGLSLGVHRHECKIAKNGVETVVLTGRLAVLQSLTAADPATQTSYGSIEGVSLYVGSILPLSETSKPSSAEVLEMLELSSQDVDYRIAAVGYETPVVQPQARRILDKIANLYVASEVYQRLASQVGPNFPPPSMSWSTIADEWMDRIESDHPDRGKSPIILFGVPKHSVTGNHRTPSIVHQGPSFVQETEQRMQDFNDGFGGPFRDVNR